MSYVLIFSHVARRYMIQFACLEVVHILILSRPNWEGGGGGGGDSTRGEFEP